MALERGYISQTFEVPSMKPIVLYFSRTGNTKLFAEAISQLFKAPVFDIASSQASIVEDYDMVILGTPVEGSSPAKEARAFVESLPQAQGRKVALFVTYRLFGNERTMKALEKILAGKGYTTILKVSKKVKTKGVPIDFSEALEEIKKFV